MESRLDHTGLSRGCPTSCTGICQTLDEILRKQELDAIHENSLTLRIEIWEGAGVIWSCWHRNYNGDTVVINNCDETTTERKIIWLKLTYIKLSQSMRC